jgi:hypothetical protein
MSVSTAPFWTESGNRFGQERLIYGSNWPVCEQFADLATVQRIPGEYFEEKGTAVAAAVLAGNAVASTAGSSGAGNKAGAGALGPADTAAWLAAALTGAASRAATSEAGTRRPAHRTTDQSGS